MKTVIGMFDNYENAEYAIDLLHSSGIEPQQISVVTQETVVQEHLDEDQIQTMQESAGAGAMSGGVVGGLVGLLAGAAMVALPGIGPVVAAGSLATTLGSMAAGAGIGAAYGGLVGALVGMGISEEEANVFASGLREGNLLVVAETSDERHLEAMNAMRQANVVKLETRPAEFEAGVRKAPPLTDEEKLETLNALVETCQDSRRAFEIAAKNVRNTQLEQLFSDHARERAQFAAALQKEIERLGGRPTSDTLSDVGSAGDAVQRGWLNLKAALTIQEESTAHVLVEALQEDEVAAIKNYQQALSTNLPEETRSLVEHQDQRIQETLDRLREIDATLDRES